MPYIAEAVREHMIHPQSSGELNYCLTETVELFLDNACEAAGVDVPTYAMFNAVVGALESCKLEFYRRAVAPYENVKLKENGDIPLYERMSRHYYRSIGRLASIIRDLPAKGEHR